MSLKTNLAYNFLLSVSQLLFPLLSIPYISRVLDPSGIGKVSFIDSFTYYFIIIAEFGIVAYGIREVARKKKDPEALSKLVSELFFLHCITSAIALLAYLPMVYFVYQKIGDYRLLLFSFSFLLVNFFSCEWYFWGTEKFKFIATRSIFTRVLGLISIFILVKAPEDYFIYYGIITGSAILTILWNSVQLFREVKISFKNINWKQHIPYLIIMYQISLVYGVTILLDNVFLGLVSTAAAVAYYAFAIKIVRISSAVITDTFLVFYPKTVTLLQDNDEPSLQKAIVTSSQIILLTTLPLGAGIFLLSETLTTVYFGNAFLPVATNLQILSLYPLLKSFNIFIHKQLLMPYNLDKLVLKSFIVGSITFIVATLGLSYLYADRGASYAIIISEAVVLACNFSYATAVPKRFILIDVRTLLQALAGVLLFIPVIFFTDMVIHGEVVKILVSVISCIFIYVFFLSIVMKNTAMVNLLNAIKTFFAFKPLFIQRGKTN
ncbi:MAG: oligosaccharide flippase family protein [Chitinophagaceae bacterium]